MNTTTHNGGRAKEAKTSIKGEYEQKLLESTPSQSTIAHFNKSGQAAFGNVDAQLLKKHSEAPGKVQKWMLDRVRESLAAASELYHDDVLILRSLLGLKYSANTTGFQFLLPELSRLMRSNLTYAVTFTNYVFDAPTSEVPRTTKDDLLRAVAQDLGAVSIDMRDHENIERQLAAFERKKDEDIPGPRPLAKLSAAALGLFTKHFYGLGMYKPIESMIAHLRSEMDHALEQDLHTTYVPFLQELIGLMLMYGIPLANATYSSFFESVLQHYFMRFIGQEPEQKNSAKQKSWTRRAIAAHGTLESFDHSYFCDILGERYAIDVLPALVKLRGSTAASQAHSRFDSLTTAATTGAKDARTPVSKNDDKIDPAPIASILSLTT
ncbi:hypothetical protein BU25DRAFT_180156 [Macroventuria anomochaeta]|uniref:Uncharacterized protein n=1 Tax=Macroventuria anomochaeta TaxID=301207 RepID=A0ACB6RPP2_9PLEO|nr:uncharacterized protein BU25DRAFT_180156 [Macroventuria anomochaeta]KAF2623232.1 hypothetical protein BU25DRAFT_180156 [Macroventuria anomochaeta]